MGEPPDDESTDSSNSDLAEYYREIVSILFAVVLALSLPKYGDAFNPEISFGLAQFVGLVSIHAAIVGSWIGYHEQLADADYKPSTWPGRLRLLDDLLIVLAYAVLLFSVDYFRPNGIEMNPLGPVSSGRGLYLLAFVGIYLLYISNDLTIRWEQEDPENLDFLTFNFIALLVFVLFTVLYMCGRLGGSGSVTVPVLALLVVVVYRVIIFHLSAE